MGDDLGGHVPGPAVKISRIRHGAPLRATAQARPMISLPGVEFSSDVRTASLRHPRPARGLPRSGARPGLILDEPKLASGAGIGL